MTEIIHHIPEVPVSETWEWKSDILQAYDGTEQRIALRGAPRFKNKLKFLATTQSDLNKLWSSLLVSRSKIWMPEFQYATKCTQNGSSGRLYFDPDLTDIRVGEYLYVKDEDDVYQVLSVYADGCSVDASIQPDAGTIIAPVEEMILFGTTSMNRYSVSDVGDFNIDGIYRRSRPSLIRPGNPDPLTYWNSVAVLDCRPLANQNPKDSIIEDNIIIDNEISLQTLVNRWDEAKVQLSRQYLVHRVPQTCTTDVVKNLDWWRHFFQFCRGSARKFWLPLYYYDHEVIVNPPVDLNSIVVKGFDYVDLFNQKEITHLWLQITSASWVHRTKVSALGGVVDGTEIFLTNNLPSLAEITRVELLLPCRLQGDSVELEHHSTYTILSLNFRSAENV